MSSLVLSIALLTASVSLSKAMLCSRDFACDSVVAHCEKGAVCVNPTGQPLGGCCVPEGLDMDETEEEGTICNDNYACDNILAGCGSDLTECMNPSGLPLGGCCVPLGYKLFHPMPEMVSSEHICGDIHMCDDFAAQCVSEGSHCVNPTGIPLGGCCTPAGLELDEKTFNRLMQLGEIVKDQELKQVMAAEKRQMREERLAKEAEEKALAAAAEGVKESEAVQEEEKKDEHMEKVEDTKEEQKKEKKDESKQEQMKEDATEDEETVAPAEKCTASTCIPTVVVGKNTTTKSEQQHTEL